MGLFDKVKEKTMQQMDTLKSKEITGKIEKVANNAISNYNESKKEQSITLPVKKQFSKTLSHISIRRDSKNYLYISKNFNSKATKYKFERFQWNGSTFTQETVTNGVVSTKGRLGKTIVGGLAFGPVGAVVGASGKRKSKVSSISKTTNQEIGSEGILFLRNIEDNSIKEVKLFLNSSQANNLERFVSNIDYIKSGENKTPPSDEVKELKELKELLDLNIITQEEFNLKKKKLLDL